MTNPFEVNDGLFDGVALNVAVSSAYVASNDQLAKRFDEVIHV